jgi:hypothetical protein
MPESKIDEFVVRIWRSKDDYEVKWFYGIAKLFDFLQENRTTPMSISKVTDFIDWSWELTPADLKKQGGGA